jgi:hypothetical protein
MKIRYDDVIIVVHENNIWFLYTLYIGMGATYEGAFRQFYYLFFPMWKHYGTKRPARQLRSLGFLLI